MKSAVQYAGHRGDLHSQWVPLYLHIQARCWLLLVSISKRLNAGWGLAHLQLLGAAGRGVARRGYQNSAIQWEGGQYPRGPCPFHETVLNIASSLA